MADKDMKDIYDRIQSVVDKTTGSKVKSQSKPDKKLVKVGNKLAKMTGMKEDWAEKVKIYRESKAWDKFIPQKKRDLTNTKAHKHEGGYVGYHFNNKQDKWIPHPEKKFKEPTGAMHYAYMKGGLTHVREDYGAGFDATTELDDKYRKDTPGQSATLKRIKKLVRERKYGVNSTHLKPRRTTGYTGVPGKNLKGKGDSGSAMNLGRKKIQHAKKDLEDN